MAQVVYVYAVFGRGRTQNVVFVKKVERREIDSRNQLVRIFTRTNMFQRRQVRTLSKTSWPVFQFQTDM